MQRGSQLRREYTTLNAVAHATGSATAIIVAPIDTNPCTALAGRPHRIKFKQLIHKITKDDHDAAWRHMQRRAPVSPDPGNALHAAGWRPRPLLDTTSLPRYYPAQQCPPFLQSKMKEEMEGLTQQRQQKGAAWPYDAQAFESACATQAALHLRGHVPTRVAMLPLRPFRMAYCCPPFLCPFCVLFLCLLSGTFDSCMPATLLFLR